MKWELDYPGDDENEIWVSSNIDSILFFLPVDWDCGQEENCCCCVPCLKWIRKEHIEAFIYWAIVCWASCCMGGRRRHGRADISYSQYAPLKTSPDDESVRGDHYDNDSDAFDRGNDDGGKEEDEEDGNGGVRAGVRSRSSSVSSKKSTKSNKSAKSSKSAKSNKSAKSSKSNKSSGRERAKSGASIAAAESKEKGNESSGSDLEDSADEFHAGPADRSDDQRQWVRSLLWR